MGKPSSDITNLLSGSSLLLSSIGLITVAVKESENLSDINSVLFVMASFCLLTSSIYLLKQYFKS